MKAYSRTEERSVEELVYREGPQAVSRDRAAMPRINLALISI
jgi:hypothetical protein